MQDRGTKIDTPVVADEKQAHFDGTVLAEGQISTKTNIVDRLVETQKQVQHSLTLMIQKVRQIQMQYQNQHIHIN